MSLANVRYEGFDRAIETLPGRKVAWSPPVDLEGEQALAALSGRPTIRWSWLITGLELLHHLGDLDDGGDLQAHIDVLLEGVSRAEMGHPTQLDGPREIDPDVPGLVFLACCHDDGSVAENSDVASSAMHARNIRRVDLAAIWASQGGDLRHRVARRDPVLAAALRPLMVRGASEDRYVEWARRLAARRPALEDATDDLERRKVWDSLPSAVRDRVAQPRSSREDLGVLWYRGTDLERVAISVVDPPLAAHLDTWDCPGAPPLAFISRALDLGGAVPPWRHGGTTDRWRPKQDADRQQHRDAVSGVGRARSAAGVVAVLACLVGAVAGGPMWWIGLVVVLVGAGGMTAAANEPGATVHRRVALNVGAVLLYASFGIVAAAPVGDSLSTLQARALVGGGIGLLVLGALHLRPGPGNDPPIGRT